MIKNIYLILFLFINILNAGSQVYVPLIDSIPMRDGKKLAADIYVHNLQEPRPVILVQTPYNRLFFRWGLPLVGTQFNNYEYNFVVVDWRGFYGSQNAYVANYNRGLDGYDIIEWIAQQPWSNGKIGMWGPSTLGKIQYQTAKEHPPHLTCFVPIVSAPQTTYQEYYPGGVLRTEYIQQLDNLGFGISSWVLASPYYNYLWSYLENTTFYPEQINVPMLMIGGWFDHNIDLMINFFNALQANVSNTANYKFLIGPWTHGGHGTAHVGSEQQGELTFPNAYNWNDSLSLRFFDYYLRGIQNNWENEPSIIYYQIGEDKWKTINTFQELQTNAVNYYLNTNNTLTTQVPVDNNNYAFYLYNPANPSPTIGGPTLRTDLLQGPYDQSQIVESRDDILIFTTETITDSIKIFGKPQVTLFVSSDCKDTDFAIRLCDVYPDGRSILIGDGIKRMRFKNGYTINDTAFMSTNQVYMITIDLPYIAYTFLPGHAIRIDITSSNYPRFDNNLNNGLNMYTPGDTIVATNTVYLNSIYPSKIELPVISENNSYFFVQSNQIPEVFPNPFNSYIHINIENIASIKLVDMFGKIYKIKAENVLDLSFLERGVYVLTLKTLSGEKYDFKLVKI